MPDQRRCIINTLFLLGAGFSKAAGIDTDKELGERLLSRLLSDPRISKGFAEQYVESCRARVSQVGFESVVQDIRSSGGIWNAFRPQSFQEGLTLFGSDDGRLLAEVANYLILDMLAEIRVHDFDAAYVATLLRFCVNTNASISSLNFDLILERCSKVHGLVLDRGVEHWKGFGPLAWNASRLKYIKVHGSLDWFFVNRQFVLQLDCPAYPQIIFGDDVKVRAEPPFHGLFQQFYTTLFRTRKVVVIGYSFRDEHVNGILWEWLADPDGRKRQLHIVDPFRERLPDLAIPAHRGFLFGTASSFEIASVNSKMHLHQQSAEAFVTKNLSFQTLRLGGSYGYPQF